eukprot:3654487-Pleurochrysis_carterae.AAC.1
MRTLCVELLELSKGHLSSSFASLLEPLCLHLQSLLPLFTCDLRTPKISYAYCTASISAFGTTFPVTIARATSTDHSATSSFSCYLDRCPLRPPPLLDVIMHVRTNCSCGLRAMHQAHQAHLLRQSFCAKHVVRTKDTLTLNTPSLPTGCFSPHRTNSRQTRRFAPNASFRAKRLLSRQTPPFAPNASFCAERVVSRQARRFAPNASFLRQTRRFRAKMRQAT